MFRKRIAEDTRLSFLDHLEELRSRLIVCAAVLCAGAALGLYLAPRALEWLITPLEKAGFARNSAGAGRGNEGAGALQTNRLRLQVGPDGALRLAGGVEALRGARDAALREGQPAILVFEEAPAPLSPPPSPDSAPAPGASGSGAPSSPASGDSAETGLPVTFSPSPASASRPGVIYLRPLDPFLLNLKVALLIGAMLTIPVILWQIWAFVAPGLTRRERRWAGPVIVSGTLLFPIGALFAYFLLAFAIEFLGRYAAPGVDRLMDLRAYLGFALTTMVSFGIVFEAPVAVILATRIGLVSAATLRRRRREVFIALLVLSAILTPTGDPFTLMALSLPLYALFEASVWLSSWLDSRPEVPLEDA